MSLRKGSEGSAIFQNHRIPSFECQSMKHVSIHNKDRFVPYASSATKTMQTVISSSHKNITVPTTSEKPPTTRPFGRPMIEISYLNLPSSSMCIGSSRKLSPMLSPSEGDHETPPVPRRAFNRADSLFAVKEVFPPDEGTPKDSQKGLSRAPQPENLFQSSEKLEKDTNDSSRSFLAKKNSPTTQASQKSGQVGSKDVRIGEVSVHRGRIPKQSPRTISNREIALLQEMPVRGLRFRDYSKIMIQKIFIEGKELY